MTHVVHQRLIHALESLNKDMTTVAEQLNFTRTQLENALASDSLIPLSMLTKICNDAGINREYALLNRNPMLKETSSPQSNDTLKPDQKDPKDAYEEFKARLAAVIDLIPMSNTEIADVLDVSKQSVGRWPQTGQISKDYLRALCEIEGLDYDWVVTGEVNTKAAEETRKRVYASKISEIDAEITRLQELKGRLQ